VYNYKDLESMYFTQNELINSSDTFLLSKLLNKHYTSIINRLDGIFSFAYYKSNENKVLLVVDPLGVKPLYYRRDNNRICFSSDFKLLMQNKFTEDMLEPIGVTSFFALRYSTGSKTVINGIHKLRPGEYIEIANESIKKTKYWKPVFDVNYSRKNNEWCDLLDDAFQSSLNDQYAKNLLSAVMLSGGFDSSSLVGGFKHLKKHISSFSCYYNYDKQITLPTENHNFSVVNHTTDESQFAEQVFRRFDTNHFSYQITIDDLYKFSSHIINMGEPMASIDAFGHFCLASQIPNEYKVVYSGVGNDELYGGYTDIYFGKHGYLLNREMGGIDYIRSLSDPQSQLLDLLDCLVPEMINIEYMVNEFDCYLNDFKYGKNEKINRSALMFLTAGDLPWWELKQADAMYMAFGIEVRVPFLSKKLVDLALQIPSIMKYRPGEDKVILKQALSRYVPNDVIKRAKCPSLGFPIEMFRSPWFENLLKEQLNKNYACFKKNAVKKKLEKVKGRSILQYYDLCYRYVIFSLWLDMAISGKLFYE
ncbi:asparagine synthetase B family protein, partial [Candidatus Neomarinimicrobiota bacterium]